jgi:hypothetical protein
MSLREQLLKAGSELRKEPVTFFGESCFVKAWTARQRDEWEAGQSELNKIGKALDNFRAVVVCRSLVDANDNLIFKPEDADDVGKMNAAEIVKIFAVCQELHGIGADASALKKSSS